MASRSSENNKIKSKRPQRAQINIVGTQRLEKVDNSDSIIPRKDSLTDDLGRSNFKSNGIARVIENALNDKKNRIAFEVISQLRKKGETYQAIADNLNERSIRTRKGNKYSKGTVKCLFDRFSKYYDVDKITFVEGKVEIKSKNVSTFGFLNVLDGGDVQIVTNIKPFKPFTLMGNDETDFKKKATSEILSAFTGVKNRIVVANFLHYEPKKNKKSLEKRYFPDLQKILLNKPKVTYSRYLQIPHSIWPFIQEQEKNLLKDLPLESLIVAQQFMQDNLKNHIKFCFDNLDKFGLYIIRTQRTYSTFAVVDSNTLIEEDFIINKDGEAASTYIKLFRAKKENIEDPMFSYIESRKQIILNKVAAKGRRYINADKDLYQFVEVLLSIFQGTPKKNRFKSFSKTLDELSNSKNQKLKLVSKNVLNEVSTDRGLYNKFKNVLAGIEIYKTHLSKALELQSEHTGL